MPVPCSWRLKGGIDGATHAAAAGAGAGFEPDPTELKVGVRLDVLRKVFGGGKVAVAGTSLNMLESQVGCM